MARKKTYDRQCYELAVAFIDDVLPKQGYEIMKAHYETLAIRIQETIEEYLVEHERTP